MNFQGGDRVWCSMFGWGEVAQVKHNRVFGICVAFDSGSICWYTPEGKLLDSKSQPRSLYFEEFTIPDSALTRPLWTPNRGEFVAVKQRQDKNWQIRQFVDRSDSGFRCKNTQGTSVFAWDMCRSLSEFNG